MSTPRTITGNLAADVDVVIAGRITIAKLRVIENTGEYRAGKYVEHSDATTHFVEAKFELGENVAATLHKGDPVIVVGREHTTSWGEEGSKSYGRVIEADAIGVDLSRAVAQVRRNSKPDHQD
ncbi:MAG TPA: single-stranded DNA-binding protein [Glaciihabitans sp.]|jgi:single-strand DNA-binding protein|nr:single-stranded DNA-binding protein [Glaciihabitans sp.]